MKFKKGDKVIIIGSSCNVRNKTCCETYKKLVPYMVILDIDIDKIHIVTPNGEKGNNGCSGCSGFTEKDLKFFKPSLKTFLERR